MATSVFMILLLTVAASSSSVNMAAAGEKTGRPDCLRVDAVQARSAVIHWRQQQSSTKRLSHIVLCAGTYYEQPVNGSWAPAADYVTRYVPMEVHQLELTHLKPNANYSCTVETEHIGPGRPCYFTTEIGRGGGGHVESDSHSERLSEYRARFNHMAATILLGGVLPMLLVGGCIGAIYLCMRYQTFRQKAKYMKQYQRVPTFGPSGAVIPGSPATVPPSPYNNRYGTPYKTVPQSPVPFKTVPQSPVVLSPYKTLPLQSSPQYAASPSQPLPSSPLTTQPFSNSATNQQTPTSLAAHGEMYGVVTSHTAPVSPAPASPQPTATDEETASLPKLSPALDSKRVERDMSIEFESRGITFNPPPPPPPPSLP